jgi:hypothetical protein
MPWIVNQSTLASIENLRHFNYFQEEMRGVPREDICLGGKEFQTLFLMYFRKKSYSFQPQNRPSKSFEQSTNLTSILFAMVRAVFINQMFYFQQFWALSGLLQAFDTVSHSPQDPITPTCSWISSSEAFMWLVACVMSQCVEQNVAYQPRCGGKEVIIPAYLNST